MRAYADSSFIVSLYLPEPQRTERATAYMGKHQEALPFTPQHRLEVRNAIRLLAWSKKISAVDRSRAYREIEEDLDAEIFLVQQIESCAGVLHHHAADFDLAYLEHDGIECM